VTEAVKEAEIEAEVSIEVEEKVTEEEVEVKECQERLVIQISTLRWKDRPEEKLPNDDHAPATIKQYLTFNSKNSNFRGLH